MGIQALKIGTVATQDVRAAFAEAELPSSPHFLILTSHDGPFSLTTLALEKKLLIDKSVEGKDRKILVPVNEPLSVGQRLGWVVFAGFKVPRVAAFLIFESKIRYLGNKNDITTGGIWPARRTLNASHLS